MNGNLKTLLTLGVLGVLLLGGVAWGWSSMTSPFPKTAAPKLCVKHHLKPGARVAAPKVTVSVYNGSDRVGLAERTLSEFEDQGFGAGKVGNAPKGTTIPFAQVWTSNPSNPAVQLVLSRLGPQATAVRKHHAGAGVVVMVGAGFEQLVDGQSSIKVTKRTSICSPPAT